MDSLIFSSQEPTSIQTVKVENALGQYTVRYDSENGGYVIGDVPAELADTDKFIQFMIDCAALSAKSKLADENGDPAAFGLEPAAALCEVLFDDGKILKFAIGMREPVSRDYYLKVDGVPGLYTYPKAAAEVLQQGQETFLSLQVTPKLTVSSPLSALRDVRFSGKKLETPIIIQAVLGGSEQIRRDALSFGAATHLIRGLGTHELDQAGGIRVLGSLLDIRAIRVEGFSLSPQEKQAYGFDDPDMKAEFILADRKNGDQKITLSLVQSQGDSFFAAIEGRDAVYLVNRPAFYDLSYDELIMRYFLSPMLVDITGLTLRTLGKEYQIEYERTEERETLVSVNGVQADSDLFFAFYRLVTSAAADGTLRENISPQGEPLLQITYHYKTDEKTDDTLKFYPGAPRRMDVWVNGIIELDIRESFISRVIQACESLTNGTKIEEVW